MNEYQETYEKEISLMDLMFYCLKKWRWIVASMLILAVLAGGYKYQATVKGNALKKEAEALGDDKKEENQESICHGMHVKHRSWDSQMQDTKDLRQRQKQKRS